MLNSRGWNLILGLEVERMTIRCKQAGKTAGICIAVVLTALIARAADDGWPQDVALASSECAIAPEESSNGSTTCDDCSAQTGCVDTAAAVPTFGGCCWERAKLTGDWCGCRTYDAQQGITYDFDSTNYYFGVTSGGLDREFEFGGHNDYVVNIDCGKLGGQEGLFIKLRAEHRYGEDINGDTGAFLPSTLATDLPVADSEAVCLTNVLFTQMLSEQFGVFIGKLDTLDGDQNAFASGRGKTQFSDLAFIFNPVALRTIPYSTLGCGFVYLKDGAPFFTYTLLNATDTTTTSGFDELFAEGVAMSAELRVPVKLGGLPGHQLFGSTWNSRDFVSLGQDPRVIYPDVPIARQSGSWSLYWNGDQYLYVHPNNSARGWGVFGRAGIADNDTNPLSWFLSSGVGGTGLFCDRPFDTFGAGYYFAGSSNEIGPIIQAAFGPIGDGQGVELFYNYQVTPWCHVTPDFQVVMPSREQVDTALVVGVRAKIDF